LGRQRKRARYGARWADHDAKATAGTHSPTSRRPRDNRRESPQRGAWPSHGMYKGSKKGISLVQQHSMYKGTTGTQTKNMRRVQRKQQGEMLRRPRPVALPRPLQPSPPLPKTARPAGPVSEAGVSSSCKRGRFFVQATLWAKADLNHTCPTS